MLETLSIAGRYLRDRHCLPSKIDGIYPLDQLARELTERPARHVERARVERAIVSTERLAEKLPWIPRTCLYRSFARFATLRAAGHPAVLVMALPRDGEGDGHAWVTLDGEPFCEEQDLEDLVVTFCYPANIRTNGTSAETKPL
ncbi:MAG: lasso peptide biosynthesis B2 protein [Deltaproteobacteria bacterium]|nr:lasso peptide biosynthesis B2 protein [Deltaproteobacteria bacterium]